MVPLPLFKFAALFVRHISKYGANWIKDQAHDHPRFRTYAARYGQYLHQFNMRLQVTLLRDKAAEKRAREKAEAPTVRTEEEQKAYEAAKAKEKADHHKAEASKSIWKRKFRPLQEEKAVDLFADVIGDSFILGVAIVLILYEYIKTRSKVDPAAEKLAQLEQQLEQEREEERETKQQIQQRVETLEQAIEEMKKATAAAKKKGILTFS